MTDWQDRPKSVFLSWFYFFGGAAIAVAVEEKVIFISIFPSFSNQSVRQLNTGTVGYTMFM